MSLHDYLSVIRRRKITIVLTTLAFVGAAVVVSSLQTPVYEGRAELLFQQSNNQSLFDASTGQPNDPQRLVQTQIQVLTSAPVRAAVQKRLGNVPSVSATAVGQTDVIAVRSQSTQPHRAAIVANAYANAYIDFRRTQAVDQLVAAGRELQDKITAFHTQINALDAQIASAPNSRASLAAERSSLVGQQALFGQKLDQLQVDAALKTGDAQLVTPAAVPTSPVKPRPIRSAVIALVLGLLLGGGLAFLRDYLDDSIKTKEDLDRAVEEIPNLGLIPAVPGWKAKDEPRVISMTEPGSPAAEAYRSLRTSVQFIGLERPMNTLQVTSPGASEGKTTTLANLGVALARAGQRVIVVCCDLRRPRIHEFFGLDNGIGFTSVLLGDVPLSAAMQRVPGEDGLRILASGPLPPNPSELLASARAAELIAALQTEADVVLIDSPPLLPVTDAAVLSARVDAMLVVATAASTTRKTLTRSLEILQQVDAPVVGTVLNGVSARGGYGYHYAYYRREEREQPRRWLRDRESTSPR